jgi:uncharacterized protein (TIGR03084 family)
MTIDMRAFRAECAELESFLTGLSREDWRRRTTFYGWTVADEIMHLCQVDGFGRIALDKPEAFPELIAWVRAGQAEGIELSQRMRETWGALEPEALIVEWCKGWAMLAGALDKADPDRRLPWFGPDIRPQSFANARQMEVWAHGQDIYDLFAVERQDADRLRTICDLGVRTHGYSFAQRGLERPVPPEVVLTSPAGSIWSWNKGASEKVIGSAVDFALVVTHRRHAVDTALITTGEGASAWLAIAQCFAGEPRDWSVGSDVDSACIQ